MFTRLKTYLTGLFRPMTPTSPTASCAGPQTFFVQPTDSIYLGSTWIEDFSTRRITKVIIEYHAGEPSRYMIHNIH